MRSTRLALLVVLLVTAGCGADERAPRWLRDRAAHYAATLGDREAKVAYIVRPVPLVVLEGTLRSGSVEGTAAAIRFDPQNHVFADWSLIDGNGCDALKALGRPYANWCSKLRR